MDVDKNTVKIRRAVRERGITALYHFTPLVNLGQSMSGIHLI